MTNQALIARRDAALGAGTPLFYTHPLHLVRGEGVHLFDPAGRRYTDMYNNVPCVGHANPDVTAAMTRAQSTLNVHSRYLHDDIVTFCERLAGLHKSAKIESVIVSCSGTEAIEVAIRMARFATGNQGIICSDGTYHGNSELVSKLTRLSLNQDSASEVRAIPFPETYRPLLQGASETDLADAYLARLAASIDTLQRSGQGVACLIFCSILANEGLPDIPAGFMQRASAMVHEAGGLVISDEVQAGYGRTGQWWGYDVSGLQPDIVVTGKPMGNGLPLAATAASRALIETFRAKTRYFNTFASSPLQAAVGLAVIDYIENNNLLASVTTVGAHLKSSLLARKSAWPAIGDIRGTGLFLGIELIKPDRDRTPDPDLAIDVINRLKDKGFLTSNAGIFRNTVKIRPPLVFAKPDADAFLAAWDEMVSEMPNQA